jgi:hypothetical protein
VRQQSLSTRLQKRPPFVYVSTAVKAIKKKWLEYKQLGADSDTDPLTDVEYDDQLVESDAGGETASSLAAAGTSSQKRPLEMTPPPPGNKPKKQVRAISHSSVEMLFVPSSILYMI